VLRNRLLIASILIALVVYALNEGELFFFSLVALLILLSGYEFYQLMRVGGHQPLAPLGLTIIAIFLLQAYVGADWTRHVLIAAIIVTMLAAIFRRSDQWLVGWALIAASRGAIHCGGPGSKLGKRFWPTSDASRSASNEADQFVLSANNPRSIKVRSKNANCERGEVGRLCR